MSIRVHDELSLAPDRVEQKTRFFARGRRVARQRYRHMSAEEFIVVEVIRTHARIVGEAPDMPIGEASGGADVLIIKYDPSGIVAYHRESGARDIVEFTWMIHGRIDRAQLSVSSVDGCEGETTE